MSKWINGDCSSPDELIGSPMFTALPHVPSGFLSDFQISNPPNPPGLLLTKYMVLPSGEIDGCFSEYLLAFICGGSFTGAAQVPSLYITEVYRLHTPLQMV